MVVPGSWFAEMPWRLLRALLFGFLSSNAYVLVHAKNSRSSPEADQSYTIIDLLDATIALALHDNLLNAGV